MSLEFIARATTMALMAAVAFGCSARTSPAEPAGIWRGTPSLVSVTGRDSCVVTAHTAWAPDIGPLVLTIERADTDLHAADIRFDESPRSPGYVCQYSGSIIGDEITLMNLAAGGCGGGVEVRGCQTTGVQFEHRVFSGRVEADRIRGLLSEQWTAQDPDHTPISVTYRVEFRRLGQ